MLNSGFRIWDTSNADRCPMFRQTFQLPCSIHIHSKDVKLQCLPKRWSAVSCQHSKRCKPESMFHLEKIRYYAIRGCDSATNKVRRVKTFTFYKMIDFRRFRVETELR